MKVTKIKKIIKKIIPYFLLALLLPYIYVWVTIYNEADSSRPMTSFERIKLTTIAAFYGYMFILIYVIPTYIHDYIYG